MKRLLALLTLAACAGACGPAPDDGGGDGSGESQRYSEKRASPDGIGKVYMGREISRVMGHRAAGWLERPERERQERTDLLIDRLVLSPDDVVADVGAGTGYFSVPIAERVPGGKVLAVDIQQEMLDLIEQRQRDGAPANIETVLGTVTDPNLPEQAVDLVLMVDAYHEFSHPYEMGTATVEALKPGGKLILVEYRGEDPSVPIKPLHKMTEAQAIKEMRAIGLTHLRTERFLPQQHFLVFEKPAADPSR
jgi:precorrin-6B methylase 2